MHLSKTTGLKGNALSLYSTPAVAAARTGSIWPEDGVPATCYAMRGNRGVSLVPSSTLPLIRKTSPPLALSLSNFISSWVPHFIHYTLTPPVFLVLCQSTIWQKSFSWGWEGCRPNKRPSTALAKRPTFTEPGKWQIILQVIHHKHNCLSKPSFWGALSSKLHTQKSSQRSHSVLSDEVHSWLGRNNVIPLGTFRGLSGHLPVEKLTPLFTGERAPTGSAWIPLKHFFCSCTQMNV